MPQCPLPLAGPSAATKSRGLCSVSSQSFDGSPGHVAAPRGTACDSGGSRCHGQQLRME